MENYRKPWEKHGITMENQSVVPHQNNSKCWIPSIILIYIYIYIYISYTYICMHIYIYKCKYIHIYLEEWGAVCTNHQNVLKG